LLNKLNKEIYQDYDNYGMKAYYEDYQEMTARSATYFFTKTDKMSSEALSMLL